MRCGMGSRRLRRGANRTRQRGRVGCGRTVWVDAQTHIAKRTPVFFVPLFFTRKTMRFAHTLFPQPTKLRCSKCCAGSSRAPACAIG